MDHLHTLNRLIEGGYYNVGPRGSADHRSIYLCCAATLAHHDGVLSHLKADAFLRAVRGEVDRLLVERIPNPVLRIRFDSLYWDRSLAGILKFELNDEVKAVLSSSRYRPALFNSRRASFAECRDYWLDHFTRQAQDPENDK